jgi:hypothetical protein
MKTKHLAIIACLFAAIIQLHSQGYIVPNGVSYFIDAGLGYEIRVIQDPTDGDYGGFFLNPQDANTFSYDYYLDQGVRVFFVSSNDPISLQPIVSQSYEELLYPNAYFFANGSPFYVGLYTGPNFPANGIYSDPLFGWAELINNNGVIELLDSALEYGGAGIYAGTEIIIPEPRALALAALGTLLLGFRRRQHSAQ